MNPSVKATSDLSVAAASLEGVPTEIILTIITSLRSLDELWNLLTSSPRAWRLFNSHSLHIVEGVLTGPQSITPSRVQELIRAVALTRHDIMPFGSMEEFRTNFLQGVLHSLPSRIKRFDRLEEPGYRVNARVPTQVLRSVVATSAHLVVLSQSCLAAALVRLRDPSFRPLHCDVEKPHYRPRYPRSTRRRLDDDCKPWDRNYSGHPVQVVDTGQPTWLEEMRALRAMWMIQLFRDMQSMALRAGDTMLWSKADKEHLQNLEPAALIASTPNLESHEEELISASHYIDSIGGTGAGGGASQYHHHRCLPKITKGMMSNKWETLSPKGMWVEEWNTYVGGPDPLPEHTDIFYWHQTDLAFQWPPPALATFRLISTDQYSPIRGVSFDFFRSLGFAFWNQERMHLLGLMHGSRENPHSLEFNMFAWQSILPPEEVQAIKSGLRRRECDDS